MRLAVLAAGLIPGEVSQGAVVVKVPLPDIGTFSPYREADITRSFTGSGFVGLYEATDNGYNSFGHLFGVEESGFSRTAIQADISGLRGVTLTRATMSFDLLDGSPGAQTARVATFASDGQLGWEWSPQVLAATYAEVDLGTNLIDITSLAQARIDAGDDWLGLHLMGSSLNQWTFTAASPSESAERPNASITFEYEPHTAIVPEPAGLSGVGMVGGAFLLRRRR